MGENKYYLRIDGNTFGFVLEGIHTITKEDIEISNEDYNTFFENQSNGIQYRLKETPLKSKGLFGYLEEYTPEPLPYTPSEEEEQVLDQLEYLMELDLRLTNLELGLTE